MGHFCRICGRTRANEEFSGRGHRDHICKDCQRMPREKRDGIERLDELWGFLDQRNISAKNVARLKTLVLTLTRKCRGWRRWSSTWLWCTRSSAGGGGTWLRATEICFIGLSRLSAPNSLTRCCWITATQAGRCGMRWMISSRRRRGLHAHAPAAVACPSTTVAWNAKTLGRTRQPPLLTKPG